LRLKLEAEDKDGDSLGVITTMRGYHQENEALRSENSGLQESLEALSAEVAQLRAALKNSEPAGTAEQQQKTIQELEQKLANKTTESDLLLREQNKAAALADSEKKYTSHFVFFFFFFFLSSFNADCLVVPRSLILQVQTLEHNLQLAIASNDELSAALIEARNRKTITREELVASTASTAASAPSQSALTPKTREKYGSESAPFSPSWTPTTTRSNFENAAISNEILRDSQKVLEKALEDRETQISEVTLPSSPLRFHFPTFSWILQLKISVTQLSQDLEQTRNALNHTRQEAIQIIDSKSREIEELQRGVSAEQDMDAQLHYLQGKLEEVKSAKAKIEHELQTKNSAFDQVMEEFASKEAALQKRIRNLESDLKTSFKNHKKNLADIEALYKHEDYKTRYTSIIAENQSLWDEITEVRSLLAEINALSKQQQETNREIAKRAQALQQGNIFLLSSFIFLSSQSTVALTSAADLSTSKRDQAGVEQELTSLRDANAQLVQSVSSLQDQLRQISGQKRTLEENRETLHAEVRTVEATATALQSQVEKLAGENEALSQELGLGLSAFFHFLLWLPLVNL